MESADNGIVLPGGSGALQCLSPSSPASSSLSSSPCSSPVLTKRLASIGCSSPTYPSSYQACINQRFQAARHKFQQQAEAEHQHGASIVHSPRDLSPTATAPTTPDNSTAKQIARNTVTQVLSRFTSQQATSKLPPSNSSPFGTDYRNLAAASSPTGKSTGVLSPGIRSPIIPRAEKIHPPPVPPKKQGVNQSPSSPVPSAGPATSPSSLGAVVSPVVRKMQKSLTWSCRHLVNQPRVHSLFLAFSTPFPPVASKALSQNYLKISFFCYL